MLRKTAPLPLLQRKARLGGKAGTKHRMDSLVFSQNGLGTCQSVPASKDWREPLVRVNNEASWSWHSHQFVSAGDLGSCVVFSLGILLESSRESSATSSVTGTGSPSLAAGNGIERPVTVLAVGCFGNAAPWPPGPGLQPGKLN